MTKAIEEVYSSLKGQFRGDLIRPGDDDYETARGIWNAMVGHRPGLIARCAEVPDIQSAVSAASTTGVVTAVRCGGHSLAGFGSCADGLVIDLSRMRQVTVDRDARRARLAGGLPARLGRCRYSKVRTCISRRCRFAYGRFGLDPGWRLWVVDPAFRTVL